MSHITPKDYDEWYAKGSKLAQPHIVDFPSRSPEDLKKFVLAYCDGRIFCDHDIRNRRDLSLVFMPVGFGAFGPQGPQEARLSPEGDEVSPAHPGEPAWHAMQELPTVGPKPEREARPLPPSSTAYPDQPPPPAEPEYKAYDLEHEDALRKEDTPSLMVTTISDLFSGGNEAKVQAYREAIDAENDVLRSTHQQKVLDHAQRLKEWRTTKAQMDDVFLLQQQEWHAAVFQWEAREASYRDRLLAWEQEAARANAARSGFIGTRLQNLGVIYEDVSKAAPRSINGMPMFWSCQILNKSDWQRCREAIEQELERRENMEI